MVERIAKLGISSRRWRWAILLPCLLLIAGMFVATLGSHAGADTTAAIQEDYTLEIDSVGDVHCTDVLKYDAEWFDANGAVFEDYPSLLSRDYTQDTDQAEIENFAVDVNKRRATVTVTYDLPGAAYNEGDNWILYGYATEPADENPGELVFEEEFTANSEITLWESMDVALTTTIVAPAGATGMTWNAGKKAITYVLPWKEASTGFWGWIKSNRPLLVAIFAVVLMVGAGMLFLHVVARKKIPVLIKEPKAPKEKLPPLPPPPPNMPR